MCGNRICNVKLTTTFLPASCYPIASPSPADLIKLSFQIVFLVKMSAPRLEEQIESLGLLASYAGDMDIKAVGSAVNNPRHEGPELIQAPG